VLERLKGLFESLSGRADWMVVRLHRERRRRPNEHGMSDASAVVASQIADHLGPSQRVADEHGIL